MVSNLNVSIPVVPSKLASANRIEESVVPATLSWELQKDVISDHNLPRIRAVLEEVRETLLVAHRGATQRTLGSDDSLGTALSADDDHHADHPDSLGKSQDFDRRTPNPGITRQN